MTKEQMESVWKIQNEIEWLKNEIRDTEEKVYYFVSLIGGVKARTSKQTKSEAYIIKATQYKKVLKRQVAVLSKKRNEVSKAISQLETPVLKTILRLRYLNGNNWEYIAQEINYSERQTKRLYVKALAEIERIN